MYMLILAGIVSVFILGGILMEVENVISDWIDKKDREKQK